MASKEDYYEMRYSEEMMGHVTLHFKRIVPHATLENEYDSDVHKSNVVSLTPIKDEPGTYLVSLGRTWKEFRITVELKDWQYEDWFR